MYFAWELIPTGFVIALFWHVRYLYGTYFLPFRILHTTVCLFAISFTGFLIRHWRVSSLQIPKTNTTNMPIFASYGAINGEVSSGGEYFRYGSSLSHVRLFAQASLFLEHRSILTDFCVIVRLACRVMIYCLRKQRKAMAEPLLRVKSLATRNGTIPTTKTRGYRGRKRVCTLTIIMWLNP
jgi:hypothetical protein